MSQPSPEYRSRRPRRRKRSKWQLFKETYLPLIIAGCALLLILIFIIGSITRAVQTVQYRKQQALNASNAALQEQTRVEQAAAALSAEAKALANTYDYEGAIEKLSSYTGDYAQFPFLEEQLKEYETALSLLEVWEDNSTIPNLTFGVLIADPDRLPENDTYDKHISTQTFSSILEQLYKNGYVLVDLEDITDGTQEKTISLPVGKKPIMITQTMVNYLSYMTDGNSDGSPDKNGIGIAHKLVLDAENNITAEYINASGQLMMGAYDLVPILESFIYTHPDFSFKGARATLAVTGYEGIFGYRIQASAKDSLGDEAYAKELSDAQNLVQALKDAGYKIACNTYENLSYGNASASAISEDLTKWNNEIAPVVGTVSTLLYARNSDIAGSSTDYSGEKYEVLQQAGFTCFLTTKDKLWLKHEDSCVRQGCITVSNRNLVNKPTLYSGLFNPDEVLGS